MAKIKLNIGCGVLLRAGFINIDIIKEQDLREGFKTKKGDWKNTFIEKGAKYVEADVRKLPFKNNFADYVEMRNIIEHLPFREIVDTLKEVRRVMKKKAELVISTDDFDGIAADWLTMRVGTFDLDRYVRVMETVYGNQMHEGEFHKVAMTSDFLSWCLVSAGFKKGQLTKYPKNAPIPKEFIHGVSKKEKNLVFRNDMIVARIIK
jgi:predicted SAM-dependent methyltransferase